MIDRRVGPDRNLRRSRNARAGDVHFAAVVGRGGLDRPEALAQRIDVGVEVAPCAVGVAVDGDHALAHDGELHGALRRRLTLLDGRFAAQVEVVAAVVGIFAYLDVLARSGQNRKAVDGLVGLPADGLPTRREVPETGLPQRRDDQTARLDTGDVDRNRILGPRLQPLEGIGVRGDLGIGQRNVALVVAASQHEARNLPVGAPREGDRRRALVDDVHVDLVRSDERDRTAHGLVAQQPDGVRRAGHKPGQLVFAGGDLGRGELDQPHVGRDVEVRDVRAGDPAQHGRRGRHVAVAHLAVVQEQVLDTRGERAGRGLRIGDARTLRDGDQFGDPFTVAGQLPERVFHRLDGVSVAVERGDQVHLVVNAALAVGVGERQRVIRYSGHDRPREGHVDVVGQRMGEVQRGELAAVGDVLDDPVGVRTAVKRRRTGEERHEQQEFIDDRFHAFSCFFLFQNAIASGNRNR